MHWGQGDWSDQRVWSSRFQCGGPMGTVGTSQHCSQERSKALTHMWCGGRGDARDLNDRCVSWKSSALLQRSLSPKMYHLFRVWQAWVNKFHLEIGVTEWILAQGSEPKGNQFWIFPPNPPCGVGLPWSVQPADRGTPKVIRLSVVIYLRTAQGGPGWLVWSESLII